MFFLVKEILHFCDTLKSKGGSGDGWWAYKAQEFDTGDQDSHPESENICLRS